MKVYKVEALGSTVVFDNMDDAVNEVSMHLENEVDVFVIVEEMTEQEYEELEEHEGY